MRLFNLCFTGISGSGKTTLANTVSRQLIEKGIKVQIIDGDDTRREVSYLFGHTREERMKMNQINRLLAKYLNNNEINTIIAPFHEMREQSEIVIDTENESVEQAAQKIVSYLMENGYAV